jgi:branched-subunit amino acid aminotransferase/4-amino-4-deoxychorismate lyase
VIWSLEDGAFHEGSSVPVTDRGFRYGMSLFETVAVFEGRLLFWDEHVARLQRACAAADFAMPEIPAFQGLSGRTGVLRIYVTAGDGGPLAPASEPRVYALFEHADFPTAETISLGLRLTVSRAPVASVLGGWKTGNYWPHVQALNEAKRQGFDEAVICNVQGSVMSASMANLFVMQGDRLVTPPLALGARDGVVRAWVAAHIPVEESLLVVEDLETAAECFVTNSRLGVVPVSEIDGRKLPSRAAGEWLAVSYREEILRQ